MNSSITGILNVARSAIFANQTGVRVASQNIANAQSEGYSRRTIHFVEARPDVTPAGRLGTGVRVSGVVRVRDELLDATFRQESARASGFQLRQDVLGRIEEIFGEPSEDGLAASLDAFWTSWSDLANRPSSDTMRRAVQQRGSEVAGLLRSYAGRIDEVAQHTRVRLTEAVQSVNGIAERIGQINREIVIAEGGGHEAHDLRDQRDRLLDDLAKIGKVRVIDRGGGSIAVMLENATLVDGTLSRSLTAAGDPPSIEMAGFRLDFGSEGGALGEMVRVLGTDIPGVRGRLDELAAVLVEQVNALHTSGYTTAGVAGGAFYDPAGVTASTIALDAAVAADPLNVVSSDTAGETTNNRIALAMAALRGRASANTVAQTIPAWAAVSGSLSGRSIGEYYEDIVTETALKVGSAEHAARVFGLVAEQADARRESLSGVSTDEELIRLMNFQQAYTAATKVVTTVDEMLEAVLNMV